MSWDHTIRLCENLASNPSLVISTSMFFPSSQRNVSSKFFKIFKERKTLAYLSISNFRKASGEKTQKWGLSCCIIFSFPFYLTSQPPFQFLLKINPTDFADCVPGARQGGDHSPPADPSPFGSLHSLPSQKAWARLGRNACERLSFVLLLAPALAMCSRQDFQLGRLTEKSRLEKACPPPLPAGLRVV